MNVKENGKTCVIPSGVKKVVQRAQQQKNALHLGVSRIAGPSCIPTSNLTGKTTYFNW